MKSLILFALMGLSCISFTQNRWGVDLNVSGGYCGEHWDRGFGNTSSNTLEGYSTFYAERRQPTVGFGAEFRYEVSRRGSVNIGLRLLHNKAFYEEETILTNAEGQVRRFENTRYTAQQTLLRVPLAYRYTIGSRKHAFRPFLKAGAVGSYLLSKQLFKVSTSAVLGQATNLSTVAKDVRLGEEKLDFSRWQFPVFFGLGIMMDRYSLSIERNWFIGKQIRSANGPEFSCGIAGFGCFPPHPFASSRQWQTTYLKFSYRLF